MFCVRAGWRCAALLDTAFECCVVWLTHYTVCTCQCTLVCIFDILLTTHDAMRTTCTMLCVVYSMNELYCLARVTHSVLLLVCCEDGKPATPPTPFSPAVERVRTTSNTNSEYEPRNESADPFHGRACETRPLIPATCYLSIDPLIFQSPQRLVVWSADLDLEIVWVAGPLTFDAALKYPCQGPLIDILSHVSSDRADWTGSDAAYLTMMIWLRLSDADDLTLLYDSRVPMGETGLVPYRWETAGKPHLRFCVAYQAWRLRGVSLARPLPSPAFRHMRSNGPLLMLFASCYLLASIWLSTLCYLLFFRYIRSNSSELLPATANCNC